jgi:hypothetical protein
MERSNDEASSDLQVQPAHERMPAAGVHRDGLGTKRICAQIFGVTTPDSVETRIGTLKFNNGVPNEKTIQLVYDQIDFARGIEAFLTGMPATSVYAVCEGFQRIGIKRNQGLGITEDLMDARSLFLTPNTTTVNGYTCLDLNGGPIVLQVPQGGPGSGR